MFLKILRGLKEIQMDSMKTVRPLICMGEGKINFSNFLLHHDNVCFSYLIRIILLRDSNEIPLRSCGKIRPRIRLNKLLIINLQMIFYFHLSDTFKRYNFSRPSTTSWKHIYYPFDISRTYAFRLAFFFLNENILFWLTISHQKPFVFSATGFCSQICTVKLNLQPKVGLTYANSIKYIQK